MSAVLVTLLSAVEPSLGLPWCRAGRTGAGSEQCPPVPVPWPVQSCPRLSLSLGPCQAVPACPSVRAELSPPVPVPRSVQSCPCRGPGSVPQSVQSCPQSVQSCPRRGAGSVPWSLQSHVAPAGGSGRWEMRQGRAALGPRRGKAGGEPAPAHPTHTRTAGQQFHRPVQTAGAPKEFGTAFLAAPHASAGEYQCLSPVVHRIF